MPSTEHKVLVWALIASQFAPPFMFAGVAVLLPTMGRELSAGATQLGLVETLFLASQLASLLPIGRLADAGDKRTLYKVGLLGFGLCSLAIGCLSSINAILALRLLQGTCSAAIAATGPAILADIAPASERGKVFGRSVGAIYSGMVLGPIVAGALIEGFGWRAVFLSGGVTLLAGAGLVHAVMRSVWRRPPVGTVHLGSTLLIIAAVLTIVVGSTFFQGSSVGYASIFLGLCFTGMFIVLQGRLEDPLLDIGALVSNSPLRYALLVQLLLYMNAFCSVFMLSIYMQVSLGHPARTAGQILALGSVLMAVTAPFAGSLADRSKPSAISTAGVVCVLGATVLGTMLGSDSRLSFVALMLTVQGLGFGLFSSPNMTTIMESVPAYERGVASALGAKSRTLGGVSGMLITTVLVSLGIGNDPISAHPQTFVRVVQLSFTVLSLVTTAALLLSLLSGRFRSGS